MDVTDKIGFGGVDDELLPMNECMCGAKWGSWSGPIMSIYPDTPTACPACGRQYFFSLGITISLVLGYEDAE